jgi:hypothetical protein
LVSAIRLPRFEQSETTLGGECCQEFRGSIVALFLRASPHDDCSTKRSALFLPHVEVEITAAYRILFGSKSLGVEDSDLE